MSFTEYKNRVKKNTDLLALISEDTDVVQDGPNQWIACCPNPEHQDNTPSLRVYHNSDDSWTWYCYACNNKAGNYTSGGTDAISYQMFRSQFRKDMRPLDFHAAVHSLGDRIGIKQENSELDNVYKRNKEYTEKIKGRLPPFVRMYLQSRGLTDEVIKDWCIGFDSLPEKHGGEPIPRIIFPLLNRYKQIVGFSKRCLPGEEDIVIRENGVQKKKVSKYWNSPNSVYFNKGQYIYGLHNLDTSFNEIRITEGTMDVLTSVSYGVKNIVAALTSHITDKHVEILKKINLPVCLCLDNDEAGIKGMQRTADMLMKAGLYVKVFTIPQGKDMSEFSNIYQEKTEEYIETHSLPYWRYRLNKCGDIYDAMLNEARLKILPQIREVADTITGADNITIMRSYIKERFGILL